MPELDRDDPLTAAYEQLSGGAQTEPRQAGWDWAAEPSIRGFGIGLRQATGRFGPERCLKVFVDRKLPRHALVAPVPSFVRLPGSDDIVDVDVEPLPSLHPHGALNDQAGRRGVNAIRADRPGMPWGTYGCLLRDRYDGRVFLLGCGHVLAAGGDPRSGDRLLTADGRPAAHLVDWTTSVPSDAGYPNRVDAAIAEVDHPDVIDRLNGLLATGVSGDIRSGMPLHSVGAASGRQRTTVVCERATFAFQADVPGRGRRRIGFRDQVFCRDATAAGDSGACVFNERGRAVGLHIWGCDGRADDGRGEISVFTPIRMVLEAFAERRELDVITDTQTVTRSLERPPVDDLDDAIDVAARTIFGEARRESSLTRLAIAEVIYNRAMRHSPTFGLSVEEVCRQPDQFSCWNPGDPHRTKTLSISLADPEIAECLTIARDLVAGRVGGLTLGADRYHHRRVSPSYSRDRTPCAQIGTYVFFNDVP